MQLIKIQKLILQQPSLVFFIMVMKAFQQLFDAYGSTYFF